MVFLRCDVFHDFLNYAFEKKIFDKIHTDKVFHPYEFFGVLSNHMIE